VQACGLEFIWETRINVFSLEIGNIPTVRTGVDQRLVFRKIQGVTCAACAGISINKFLIHNGKFKRHFVWKIPANAIRTIIGLSAPFWSCKMDDWYAQNRTLLHPEE
jgi:hypothetical protein